MAQVPLNTTKTTIGTALDSVVIVSCHDRSAGVALDLSGYTKQVVQAGHVIIRHKTDGSYKPLGISGDAYEAIPSTHEAVGVLYSTIELSYQRVATIVLRGTVAEPASPHPLTDPIKKALPHIIFVK